MLNDVEEKIDSSVEALELALSENKSLEMIKPLFENLVEALSRKLVLNLNKIKDDNIDLSEEKMAVMQAEEVERYKETVAYFAHYVDKNFNDRS